MSRIFSEDALQRVVDEELSKLPDRHMKAIIRYVGDDGSLRTTLAAKVNGRWTLAGDARISLRKRPRLTEGAFTVVASW